MSEPPRLGPASGPFVIALGSLCLLTAGSLVAWRLRGLLEVSAPHPPGRLPAIEDVPPDRWIRLSRQRIFFGHQSVGYNLVDGIRDLMKTRPEIRLNIVETSDPFALSGPVFAHAHLGHNGDPISKIDDFIGLMDSGMGERVDLGLFKFCYVDVTRRSDVGAIASRYEGAMTALAARYPEIRFMRVTVPLCSVSGTLKHRLKIAVKCALGLPGLAADNEARHRFNARLRTAPDQGRAPLFDLALVESVGRDGRQRLARCGGNEAPALAAAYTDDGGHLNAEGRRRAAEQFLIALAAAATTNVTRE